jgi:hypothetical protein
MTGAIAAQIGLLAFACACLTGLAVGNDVQAVLTRALVALVLGAAAGHLAGLGAKLALRDHFARRKHELDAAHFAAVRAAAENAAPLEEPGDEEEVR